MRTPSKQKSERNTRYAEGGSRGRMFPEQAANPQKPGVTAHAVKGAAPGKRAASGGSKTERGVSLAVPAAAGRTAPPNKKGR
jgi:hypothetical protein